MILFFRKGNQGKEEDMDTKFCQRVEQLAKIKGVKMNAVLDDCRINKAAYYRWKKGEGGCPSGDQLIALAEYFNTSAEWIMTGNHPSIDRKLMKISVLCDQIMRLAGEISENSFVPSDDV